MLINKHSTLNIFDIRARCARRISGLPSMHKNYIRNSSITVILKSCSLNRATFIAQTPTTHRPFIQSSQLWRLNLASWMIRNDTDDKTHGIRKETTGRTQCSPINSGSRTRARFQSDRWTMTRTKNPPTSPSATPPPALPPPPPFAPGFANYPPKIMPRNANRNPYQRRASRQTMAADNAGDRWQRISWLSLSPSTVRPVSRVPGVPRCSR